MDEIYFQNRSNRPNRDPGRENVQPGASGGTPFDPTQAVNRDQFVVHLPQEERVAPAPDRTPHGQRVADAGAVGQMPQYHPQNSSVRPQPVQQTRQARPQPVQQNRPVRQQSSGQSSAAQQNRPVRPGAMPQNRPAQQRPVQKSNARELQNERTMAIPAAQLRQQQARAQQPQRPAQTKKRRPKKRRSKARIAAWVLLCLFLLILLLTAGGLAYGYATIGRLNYDKEFNDSNAYLDEGLLTTKKSVRNILFIGSDARDYDAGITGGRSDTMILCSVDSKHHKIKLTSFLRDAYVTIPSKGSGNRLNAAFSYGGPQLLVDTIEYNFKIKIDGYVLVDFEGFAKMIDLMGGLDVEGVTAAEAKYLRETVKILYAKEGTNHFSGKAALWYCRIRKLDSDFKRTERQRKVIGALVNQATHMNPVKLVKIVKEILPMFTTSLERSSVMTTALLAAFDYLGGDNPQFQIPVDGTWKNATINGASVLTFDNEENEKLLKEFIYE